MEVVNVLMSGIIDLMKVMSVSRVGIGVLMIDSMMRLRMLLMSVRLVWFMM